MTKRTPSAALSRGWSRRPRRWPAGQAARGGRSSCPRTSPAPGPGCRWAAEDAFPVQVASTFPADGQTGIRFALGAVGSGVAGFRRTHQQALGAHAVALAAGQSGPFVTSFADVAPLALMSGSIELVRAWVAETLEVARGR